MQKIPLVVDLDGTLIHSDLLHESSLALLRLRPWEVLLLPVWILKGKAYLKKKIAERIKLDITCLPYNEEFLEFLKKEKDQGRRLILCTASHESFAQEIASHLGIFDAVIASNGEHNLAGINKAQVLVNTFGNRGFDYAGNSTADKHVWAVAKHAFLVSGSQKLLQEVGNQFHLQEVF